MQPPACCSLLCPGPHSPGLLWAGQGSTPQLGQELEPWSFMLWVMHDGWGPGLMMASEGQVLSTAVCDSHSMLLFSCFFLIVVHVVSTH